MFLLSLGQRLPAGILDVVHQHVFHVAPPLWVILLYRVLCFYYNDAPNRAISTSQTDRRHKANTDGLIEMDGIIEEALEGRGSGTVRLSSGGTPSQLPFLDKWTVFRDPANWDRSRARGR